MSGKLGEVEGRIAATHQLDAVIAAMRGIAASRVREAHERLKGIRASAATVGAAIGEVLAFVPPVERAREPGMHAGNEIGIVVGTEQGFVGAFNDQIAAHALGESGARVRSWLLVGARLVGALAGRGVSEAWSAPMAAHPDAIVRLAARVTDALYARLGGGTGAVRVQVVHALPGESRVHVTARTLVPFDFARFHARGRAQPPLVNVAPARLLAGLVESYVYVELCEALMLSFAAENEARVRAMLAARTNVQQRLDSLTQQYRTMRQDEITSEIVELTAGSVGMRRAAG